MVNYSPTLKALSGVMQPDQPEAESLTGTETIGSTVAGFPVEPRTVIVHILDLRRRNQTRTILFVSSHLPS